MKTYEKLAAKTLQGLKQAFLRNIKWKYFNAEKLFGTLD